MLQCRRISLHSFGDDILASASLRAANTQQSNDTHWKRCNIKLREASREELASTFGSSSTARSKKALSANTDDGTYSTT